MRFTKTAAVVGIATAAALGLTASSCDDDNSSANKSDTQQVASIADRLGKGQPLPSPDYSQHRQTMIDVEEAQIHGMATTSFAFLEGVGLIATCPSIGFPVPSTAQLTNPTQILWGSNGASGEIAQMEPNGVFTGQSSGTYVVCVAPNGDKYIDYWEGYVKTVGAPAHWVEGKGIVLDGPPSVKVTEHK